MRPKLYLAVLPVFVCLSSFAQEESSRGGEEIPAAVKAMDTGLRHWKENVEFVANYRFTQAAARTFQDGVHGRFIEEFAEKAITGKGVIAKAADAFRFSFMLDGRTKVARRGKSTTTTLSSFDVAVANGIQGRYSPRQLCTDGLFVGGSITFQRAAAGLSGRFPEVNATVLTPITVCGGESSHPFLSIVPRPIYNETVRWDVRKLSGGQVSVTVTREGTDPSRGGTWKAIGKYIVRTNLGYPFIEQVQRTHFSRGRLVARSRTVTERFVQAGKSCRVPSRVISGTEITGSSLRPRVPYDFWWIATWESADIGTRRPRDDDFVLAVAEKTRVNGLQEKWRDATRFNIRQMDVSDLLGATSDQAQPAVVASVTESAGQSADFAFLSARVVCVALIVIGGGILSYASRWRRTSGHGR